MFNWVFNLHGKRQKAAQTLCVNLIEKEYCKTTFWRDYFGKGQNAVTRVFVQQTKEGNVRCVNLHTK
jgi:hypothetical protein